jgi:tetratricopeptide (TPR) repeat protein
MRRNSSFCLVIIATTGMVGGCTSPTLSGPRTTPLSGTAANAISQSNTTLSSAFGQRNTSSASTDPYGSMPVQAPPPATNTSGVALASLLQAGKSVTNALKIQPKVTSVTDPVKLDNQPSNTAQVAADLHYHAGFFRESQRDFAAAAENYRTVLEKNPNDVRAVAGFGRVQDQLGNTVEGEKYLRRACELAPKEPAPWNDLANSHFKRNKLAEAITCQEQAVALQPANAQYRGTLARYLIDADRADEAVHQLAAVHGEAAANFEVGTLLHRQHHSDRAQQYIQKAIALNPALTHGHQAQDRRQIASTRPAAGPIARTTRLPTP